MGTNSLYDFWYKNSKSAVESNGLLEEVVPQWGDLSYPEASVPRRIANVPKNGYNNPLKTEEWLAVAEIKPAAKICSTQGVAT